MAHSSWGSGWPNCQGSRINRNFYVDTRWGRVKFPGGVRNELAELVSRLVKETANRGYRFGVPGNASYGCWGYSCRAIRGRNVSSNHAWGLAVDINAPSNPMGSPLRTNMPSWMPNLWNAYGFRWGGDYASRPDAMHYEFMGSVAQAAAQTQKARANRLGGGAALRPVTRTLRQGMTGADVRTWQKILAGAGLLPASGVDGNFGPATTAATKRFQTRLGLTPDGIVGPTTQRKTQELLRYLAAMR